MDKSILPGRSFPLGATVTPMGVNFSIFAKGATGVSLLLFDDPDAPRADRVIHLDPKVHRTFYYWHVFVRGLRSGQVYAYRVEGPYAPEKGLRFDSEKVLLDPYARAVVGWRNYSREAAIHPGNNNIAQALRSVVVDSSAYNWEGDVPLNIPYSSTIIYEVHVGGLTRHPSCGLAPALRGTYAGLQAKIPYLKQLGITAVELLPIHQFDHQDAQPGLENYWGYSTMAFFAPHRGYSSHLDPLGPLNEFRDMVKALHRAGIEVILDVVFNHTAEGDERGPTLSFRGLANSSYYMLDPKNPAHYLNYSGCGNTFKANHSVPGHLILDCLRYWVAEMHVDGFRFDLASALSRAADGTPLEDPPILWSIESDPVLAGTKIIAEAWDAGGLYQVGSFIGDRFAEWNGPYRDDVRQFVRGDANMVGKLAARVLGSPDIYKDPDREPNRSINFITCHDGFTLRDLVSYNQKHNEANRENNRDGADENYSWNCGVEGPTNDSNINRLRLQQSKNFLTILLTSQGTPMLLMGDEVGHSQQGNNNAYCQDNELSWFDWRRVTEEAELLRFTQGLIHFVQSLKIFQQERLLAVTHPNLNPHIIWHGTELFKPDWRPESRSLAFSLHHPTENEHLHLIFNADKIGKSFALPTPPDGQRWCRIVDTSLASPNDFAPPDEALALSDSNYWLNARSSLLLIAYPR